MVVQGPVSSLQVADVCGGVVTDNCPLQGEAVGELEEEEGEY